MATSTDLWDQPVQSTSTRRPAPPPTPVRDDWEDDDDDDEPPSEELNRQIWEDANTKAQHPMPALILNSVSTPSTQLPPQAVFTQQPSMRILKRPSASAQSSSTSLSTTSNGGETLKEREARYHAARERIFGEDTPPEGGEARKSKPPAAQTQSVKVVREPRGPATGKNSQSPNKGFGERKAKPPNANAASSAGEGGRDVL